MTPLRTDKPVYLQLADRLCDEIMAGTYGDDESSPSVRKYAATYGVNVNTVVKGFNLLEAKGIIYQKRGLGYYVSPGAKEKILEERRHAFLHEELPDIVERMRRIGITLEDIEKQYKQLS